MLSYSVQPTPFRWMVTGVPAGPDVGVMLTILVSMAKEVRADVAIAAARRIPVCASHQGHRGSSAGHSIRPSPAHIDLCDHPLSCGSNPALLLRLPTEVRQTSCNGRVPREAFAAQRSSRAPRVLAGLSASVAPATCYFALRDRPAADRAPHTLLATDRRTVVRKMNCGLGKLAMGDCS